MLDYLIIGAGPAGLQLGYLLSRAGRAFAIVEAGPSAGSFFERFPRHRTLISNNKVYTGSDDPELNLRMDWNSLLCDDPLLRFKHYSRRYFPPASEFVRYLRDFAERYALPIRYRTRIECVTRDANGFVLRDTGGNTHRSRQLVVASGVSRPYVPPIPGIDLAELYTDVSVDPQDFVNQRVLILGKANSAFETADNLIETAAVIHVVGPHSLRLAWRTHFVGHLRAVNNNFLDTYQLKSQNALLDGEVERITRAERGYRVTIRFVRAQEVKKEISYDRIIVCTGFRFDDSIFDESCRPQLTINGRFPEQTCEWESVNVPGLHFAGTLMQVRDFKKSTCGFIHGYRYSVRALHHLLERRYQDREWPHVDLPASPDGLRDAVLARVNRSSGLWQQFAFLTDVVTVEKGEARYFEEMPIDYVRERFGLRRELFTANLEYGPGHDLVDPFDVNVARVTQDRHDARGEGHYLHPVIRHYVHGELLSTHHVTENLENDWTDETAHREPLRAYFARELGRSRFERAAPRPAGEERHEAPVPA